MSAHEARWHRPVRRSLPGIASDRLDFAESAHRVAFAHIIDLQPGRLGQIKADCTFVAEDLQHNIVGCARAHARDFDRAQRAIDQPRLQQGDIVHLDRGSFVYPRCDRPLLDQRIQRGVDRGKVAQQIIQQVQYMRAQVEERATARDFALQTPGHGFVGADIAGAVITSAKRKHPPAEAFCHQLSGARQRREEAKIECQLRLDAGNMHGFCHRQRFAFIHGQRLFAIDMLAGGCGSQGDLVMRVVGRADVDGVDIGARQQIAIVGAVLVAADFVRGGPSGGFARGGYSRDLYAVGGQAIVERDGAIGGGMHAPDPAIADQPDFDIWHLFVSFLLILPHLAP